MMATPLDLEDFARGFSLTEGVVEDVGQIQSIEPIAFDDGIELRMWIDESRMSALRDRRRRITGPTGCGLCGVESLSEAMRAIPAVSSDACFTANDIMTALRGMEIEQQLHRKTRAMHGAGLWSKRRGLQFIREDVGRHNALDKLVGASQVARGPLDDSLVILTSRVSIELINKTAVLGVPLLVAISAPTALAIRAAERAGITLAAIARDDGFEVFTAPGRILQNDQDGNVYMSATAG